MSGSDDQRHNFALPGHIQPGDVAPWWKQGRYRFAFDRAAGRYIVLGFCGNVRDRVGQAATAVFQRCRPFTDSGKISFFCVLSDAEGGGSLPQRAGLTDAEIIFDADGVVHRAYGIASRTWIVLDPMMRVLRVIPFDAADTHITALLELLDSLPPPSHHLGFQAPAPVLVLSNVFEPEFCRHLIACYEADGGRESGFMEEVQGKTVELYDGDWKRRRDFLITDRTLIEPIKERMARRIGLMVQQVFQFRFSRIERYLVACYSSADGGHFGPHRDDTVRGTEHRKFAVSINLNAEFEGGGISFPEYSAQEFKVPAGAAVIFSASILHRVSRVTQGRRYAFLPFIYDEAAERVRLANLGALQSSGDAGQPGDNGAQQSQATAGSSAN